jgi:FkbM family methyltransferase
MNLSKKIWLGIFARARFSSLNRRLLRRGLAGLGINDYGPRQEEGERHLLKRLMGILPLNAIVYDVGAHKGYYSDCMISGRPDLTIHAFEPNPLLVDELTATAAGRFTVHQFALGDQEGESILHDLEAGGGSQGASLLGQAIDELYRDWPKQKLKVPVKTLYAVAKTLKSPRIDYLKIDTEGYDLMVLRGASELIREGRLGIIQFEFNTMNVFSRSFMRDFYQILPGYRFYRIVRDGLVAMGDYNPLMVELFGHQNVVAIPEAQVSLIINSADN